jgi:hypothetical protein
MRIYLGMNMLSKLQDGLVRRNEPKRRCVKAPEKRREGGFAHEQTQIGVPCGPGWGRNGAAAMDNRHPPPAPPMEGSRRYNFHTDGLSKNGFDGL